MHILIKIIASVCTVIDADSTKTRAIHAMQEKNEHFQGSAQNFTTQN